MDGTTASIDAPAPQPPARQPPARRALRDRWLWIGVVVAVLLGVATIATILLTSRVDAPRQGSVAAGDTAAAAATATLAQLVEDAAALAASTSPRELADPAAYSQLMGALAIARSALDGTQPQLEAARSAVVAAIDRVSRSITAKALADAWSALAAVIATAVEVNAGAAGRVPDDGVRTELQVRIDAGRALLGTNATAETVLGHAQSITDQTALVLDARFMGFRDADGTWCQVGGGSCVLLAWPTATLERGEPVELAGGERAVAGSDCSATEEFRVGKDRIAFFFCPAGESLPDGYRAAGSDAGDPDRDRLWFVSGSRLSELRYRA